MGPATARLGGPEELVASEPVLQLAINKDIALTDSAVASLHSQDPTALSNSAPACALVVEFA